MVVNARRRRYVPEELTVDVLSRLSATVLLEMRRVCTRWMGLIDSPVFISEHVSRGREILQGIFFANRFPRQAEDNSPVRYMPLLNNDERPNTYTTALDFVTQTPVIALSTGHGLVCCRSISNSSNVRMYVCNPLCRQSVEIIWPYGNSYSMVSILFDPVRNPIVLGVTFLVVVPVAGIIDQWQRKVIEFRIYSSETRVWRDSINPLVSNDRLIGSSGVEVGGLLYWATNMYSVIVFDPDMDNSYTINPPHLENELSCLPEIVLGESGGSLIYVMVTIDEITVWTLGSADRNEWDLKFMITWVTLVASEITEDGVEVLPFQVWANARQHLNNNQNLRPFVAPLAYKDDVLILRICGGSYALYCETSYSRRLADIEEVANDGMNKTPIAVPYV